MTHLKIEYRYDPFPDSDENTSTVEDDFDDVKAAVEWLLNHLGYWCLDEDVTVYIDGELFIW